MISQLNIDIIGETHDLSEHTCITTWREESEIFFITRAATRGHYVCYNYKEEIDNAMVGITMLGQHCHHGHVGSFTFNMSKIGDCSEVSSSARATISTFVLFIIVSSYNCG